MTWIDAIMLAGLVLPLGGVLGWFVRGAVAVWCGSCGQRMRCETCPPWSKIRRRSWHDPADRGGHVFGHPATWR
jgi:hypothetical protein